MGFLDSAVPVASLEQSQLWCVYGKSGTGKTAFIASFPKPILYIQVGDDGTNTIKDAEGIEVLRPTSLDDVKAILAELEKDKRYKTVAIDMFSMVVNEWVDQKIVQKNKRMTQQAWGDLKTDVEELIKRCQVLSGKKIVVATCHEVSDSFEGLENEIVPEVRPNLNKGARSYFEGMCNYGIHTTILERDYDKGNGEIVSKAVYSIHLGANPYYWTKTQKPVGVKVPKIMANPSYDKIMKILEVTK